MKVLIIAYYFDPFPSVSAKRTTYWANNFSKHGIECQVITAIPQIEKKKNIIEVKDSGDRGLFGKVIKDQGLSWKKDLKRFFNCTKIIDNPDFIIFSGGPFMHFSLTKFLQNKFKAKVILDYRDPFSDNPRHNSSILKKIVQSSFEKKVNKEADLIISVNSVCAQHIKSTEVNVVANGYDESLTQSLDTMSQVKKGLIVNTGKMYNDFPLQSLVKVLKSNEEYTFHQIGERSEIIDSAKSDRLQSFDFMPYAEMLKKIELSEIALLMTGGKPFESPTKLFDYIAMNKKILVITQGEIKTGAIQDCLGDYPNVRWAKNTVSEIEAGFSELSEANLIKYDPSHHSRAESLNTLVKLLKEL